MLILKGRSNLCHCQKVTTCNKSSLFKAPPSVRLKGENLAHHVRRLSADVQTEVVEGLEVRLGKVTFNFNHQSMLIIRCFARHIYYMWVNCLAGLPCTGCSWWSRYSSRQDPERDNWLSMSVLLIDFFSSADQFFSLALTCSLMQDSKKGARGVSTRTAL